MHDKAAANGERAYVWGKVETLSTTFTLQDNGTGTAIVAPGFP